MRLSAERAGVILRGVRTDDVVAIERKRLAREHIGDIRRLDRDIAGLKTRITDAVVASGTTLTELHGSGPSPPPSSSATSVTRPGSGPVTSSPPTTQPPPSRRRADLGSATASTLEGTEP